jgi:hypothetical protein
MLRECIADDQEFMLLRFEILLFMYFDSVSKFINTARGGSDV